MSANLNVKGINTNAALRFYNNNVYQGSRSITGHSLQYAEDAAENFVLGLYDKP